MAQVLSIPDRSSWSDTERRVASIWTEVLGSPDIELDDDFVTLGGDSITATQCVNGVRDSFDVELDVDLLLNELSTVRSIAALIDERMRALQATA